MDKILGYIVDVYCPKCGSHAMAGPFYHDGRSSWFRHWAFGFMWFKQCVQSALDHFHYRCDSCKVWHTRTCRDIKETL